MIRVLKGLSELELFPACGLTFIGPVQNFMYVYDTPAKDQERSELWIGKLILIACP